MKIRLLIILSFLIVSNIALSQDFLWESNAGGFNESLAVDSNGNSYTIGEFLQPIDVDPSPGTLTFTSLGSYDIFFRKLDASGNFLWARQVGGLNNEEATTIEVNDSGYVFIGGSFEGTVDFDPGPGISTITSAGAGDIFVSKFDPNGNYVWTKTIGGIQSQIVYDIAFDNDENIYLTGAFLNTTDFDPGPGVYNLSAVGSWDIFIAKLNASGTFAWAIPISGYGLNYGFSVTTDNAVNVYCTGYFSDSADFDPGPAVLQMNAGTQPDVFIIKLDSSGNLGWAKQMGGTLQNYGYEIALDNDGNVYTTGTYYGTTDFDPGPGVYNLTANFSYTYNDVFLSKLDANGNFVWAKSFGGKFNDFGYSLALKANNIYVAGSFKDTADFDPGPGNFTLISPGFEDVFLSRFDTSGIFFTAARFGDNSADQAFSVRLNNQGNIYLSGFFDGTVDLDPGPNVYNATSGTNGDGFVLKLGQLTGIPENTENNYFNIYPNPTTGIFYVDLPSNDNYSFQLTDISGRILWQGIPGNEKNSIDITEFPGGMYFLKSENETKKIIKL